jgi:hypothetical protein
VVPGRGVLLALRRLGKEVYLFNYNGEPHGLRNRADQKDYTIRLQQYFDHYLKGAPAPDWMEGGEAGRKRAVKHDDSRPAKSPIPRDGALSCARGAYSLPTIDAG